MVFLLAYCIITWIYGIQMVYRDVIIEPRLTLKAIGFVSAMPILIALGLLYTIIEEDS